MSDKKIRAVLFDFGGVIASEGFAAAMHALARRQGLDGDALLRTATDAVYDSGYVTGEGSEADFWALLRERSGLRGDDAELRREGLSRFRVRPGMIELVRGLRRSGLLVGILSDQTDWLDLLDAEQHFYREFDRVFNSYWLGKGKRDPSLFDDVVAMLGLKPEQVIFIDDNAGNVERARSRGLHGLLFRDEPTLRAELDRLLAG